MSDKILAALNEKLTHAALPTAWPNVPISPEPDDTWIRPTWLPGVPETTAVGEAMPEQFVGIYQVDIFTPAGKGDGPARAVLALIQALYPRAGVLEYDGLRIRIEKTYPLTSRMETGKNSTGKMDLGGWYHLPVRIEYRTEI